MNSNNFVTARTLRRRIVKSLQEQQRQDSACSEQLRLAISRHTRTILIIVSDMLMNYTKSNLTDQDRSLFFSLTPSWLTPELWLQSRIQQIEAALELDRIEKLVSSAETEYGRVAPFGKMVTGWFSTPEEKAQINAAKSTLDRLRYDFQQAKSAHEAKLATVHSYAEHFLRSAMTTEGVTALLEKSSVKAKLRDALDALSRELTNIWRDHSRKQSNSLDSVRSVTTDLIAMYKSDQTNTPLRSRQCCNP